MPHFDLWLGLVQLAGALLLVVVAVLGAARVGTVAAGHRDHEVALAESVHRLAGGDGPGLGQTAWKAATTTVAS